MTKPIHTMRSYFARPGHTPVDTVTFAQGVLAVLQSEIRSKLAKVGFAPAENIERLDTVLGDPAKPVFDRPVYAYVNANAWLAKCECDGAEFVDMVLRVFMCCSCWNADVGHQWRPVIVPEGAERIEAALRVRPERNRNWRLPETVEDLHAENMVHGFPRFEEGEVA